MEQKSQAINNQNIHTQELPYFDGVCFDPDANSIYGNYNDEISAYRARKAWVETLKFNFNLEDNFDFLLTVNESDQETFVLSCKFVSATSRYAFWKITNHQAPEAQYVIETAHIPICDERYEEILTAPDLRSIYDLPLTTSANKELVKSSKKTLNRIFKKVLAT